MQDGSHQEAVHLASSSEHAIVQQASISEVDRNGTLANMTACIDPHAGAYARVCLQD